MLAPQSMFDSPCLGGVYLEERVEVVLEQVVGGELQRELGDRGGHGLGDAGDDDAGDVVDVVLPRLGALGDAEDLVRVCGWFTSGGSVRCY